MSVCPPSVLTCTATPSVCHDTYPSWGIGHYIVATHIHPGGLANSGSTSTHERALRRNLYISVKLCMHRLNVYTREGAAVIMSRYALRCISYDYKQPTTTRGTCIDLVFANFRMHPLEEPLALHFTDHKAVIMKSKRNPELSTIYEQ